MVYEQLLPSNTLISLNKVTISNGTNRLVLNTQNVNDDWSNASSTLNVVYKFGSSTVTSPLSKQSLFNGRKILLSSDGSSYIQFTLLRNPARIQIDTVAPGTIYFIELRTV